MRGIGPWEDNKLYTAVEFFKAIQPRAAQQMQMYDNMEAGGRGQGSGRGSGETPSTSR